MAFGFRRYSFHVRTDAKQGSSKARLTATKRIVKAGEAATAGKVKAKKKPVAKMSGKNKKLLAIARKANKTRR